MPYVSIRTVWSDDSITLSEAMTEWHANLLLMFYGDSLFWIGQIRPIRAIMIRVSQPFTQLDMGWTQ
jgi:hypothetical protein